MVSARIEFATDWILSRIEASDAQRQQVKAIVQATVEELMPMREQHHQNRQTMLQVLTQPTINRVVLGDVRQAELQLADTASDRIVTALANVAEVLTPEQRSKLAEFMSRLNDSRHRSKPLGRETSPSAWRSKDMMKWRSWRAASIVLRIASHASSTPSVPCSLVRHTSYAHLLPVCVWPSSSYRTMIDPSYRYASSRISRNWMH